MAKKKSKRQERCEYVDKVCRKYANEPRWIRTILLSKKEGK